MEELPSRPHRPTNNAQTRRNARLHRLRAQAFEKRGELLRRYEPQIETALLPDVGEHLLQYRQRDFAPELAFVNRAKAFHLELEFGEYVLDYALDGSRLALASSLGHVALLEWKKRRLLAEFQTKERVRAARFMSNGFLALAQASVVHVYDADGLEAHRLEGMPEPRSLEYLPEHFLLASLSAFGRLSYLDSSTGKMVAELKTGQREGAMRRDPSTGVIAVGGSKGSVGLFSPAMGKPLLRLFAHNARLLDVGFTFDGRTLVTAGEDRQFKIFDMRNTCRELFAYYCERQPRRLAISQSGLVAISARNGVTIWKDVALQKQKRAYLRHDLVDSSALVNDLQFAPYEDFLGVNSTARFVSIAVPGAGLLNFDTFAQNVAANRRQNRASEVRKLIEKLPFESIMLDQSVIGKADSASKEVIEAERRAESETKLAKLAKRERKTQISKSLSRSEAEREQTRKLNIDRKAFLRAERLKAASELSQINAVSSEIDAAIERNLKREN